MAFRWSAGDHVVLRENNVLELSHMVDGKRWNERGPLIRPGEEGIITQMFYSPTVGDYRFVIQFAGGRLDDDGHWLNTSFAKVAP